MRKIVIMVPNDQAEAIENIRRRQHISRSRVIQQAVARYLKEEEECLTS